MDFQTILLKLKENEISEIDLIDLVYYGSEYIKNKISEKLANIFGSYKVFIYSENSYFDTYSSIIILEIENASALVGIKGWVSSYEDFSIESSFVELERKEKISYYYDIKEN